jgi:hypothetical protein
MAKVNFKNKKPYKNTASGRMRAKREIDNIKFLL